MTVAAQAACVVGSAGLAALYLGATRSTRLAGLVAWAAALGVLGIYLLPDLSRSRLGAAAVGGLVVSVGVAVLRLQPSLWSLGKEMYLAELYVVPDRRGQGFGRELITRALEVSRAAGADYAFLVTSEEDQLAQKLYEAAGFRRTEGEGGPLMLAYEREL